MRRPESLPLALLVLIGIVVLGPHVPHAGLHLDDHGFHWSLAHADLASAWRFARIYTPGRNLYILYYWVFYKVLGPSPERLHMLGVGLDIVNACLAYLLLRRRALGRAPALLAAGLFLVWPNHAETHFWTSAVGMNLLSTTFILLAFLVSGWSRLGAGLRLPAAVALFALALFDYDQAFFMWIPLTYHLSSLPEKPSRRARAALAGACVLLCAGHFLLRTLTPTAGNSPMARAGAMGLRAAQSLVVSAVPMMKLPVWEALQSPAGGPVATVLLVAALAGCWIGLVCRLWVPEEDGVPPPGMAVLGGLWFVCAYLPNYFWYISPRHNYLPSLGFLMLLLHPAMIAASRSGRLKACLAGVGFLVFGLSASAALAEGYGWRRAASLHARFVAEAGRVLPEKPDNIFLAGAPRTLLRAPAFRITDEHLHLFAFATGHLPAVGDITLTPSRTGAFYRNQPSLYGAASLHWRPYAGMNVLTVSPEGAVSRQRSLILEPPGLPPVEVPLSGGGPVSSPKEGGLRLLSQVWLVSARTLPVTEPGNPRSGSARKWSKPGRAETAAPASTVFQAPNGASLAAVSSLRSDRWLEVELTWRADRRPPADFASVIRLHDAAGRLVFEPVHPSSPALDKRFGPTLSALWPAFNDLRPASGWKPGTAVVERYRLALDKPLPQGPLELRVTLFEKSEAGPWKSLGEFKAGLVP